MMELFKPRSYKQSIKSHNRTSETQVIDKPDFMELLNSMIKDGPPLEFTEEEMCEVQLCL